VERPPAWLKVPNPESNWFEFAERVFESLLMDGNAFVLISARDFQGFPMELWTLNPRNIQVRRRENTGRIYFLWDGTQELSRYGPDNPMGEVLHIRLKTAGGLRGLSPLEMARQAIGLGLVEEKFGARFFGRGQTMSGVIQLPAQQGGARETKEHIALIAENWEEAHGGSDRSHRPGILTAGATWQGITIPPEQAQFLQSRGFQIEDIATRFYGVPPHLVGLTEKQTSWGTGVAEQGVGLYRYTLKSHLTRFETAMSQLLPPGQFLRLNHRALLEADPKTEADILEIELRNGIVNFDYWRSKLDLEPRAGGNRYMIPANNQLILEPNGLPAEARAELTLDEVTVALQKIYLAVGVVISPKEARDILNRYGANLADSVPALTPTQNGNGQQPVEVTQP
jgi:HK97 family phage portal protein